MTINTTPKEKAAGGFHTTTATTIDSLDFPTGNRPDKVFSTLRAVYAMCSHTLHRTTSKDGPVTYWAERWGLVRYPPTLHDAGLFLAKIGGRL